MRISDWSSDVCSSDLRRHSRCTAHLSLTAPRDNITVRLSPPDRSKNGALKRPSGIEIEFAIVALMMVTAASSVIELDLGNVIQPTADHAGITPVTPAPEMGSSGGTSVAHGHPPRARCISPT